MNELVGKHWLTINWLLFNYINHLWTIYFTVIESKPRGPSSTSSWRAPRPCNGAWAERRRCAAPWGWPWRCWWGQRMAKRHPTGACGAVDEMWGVGHGLSPMAFNTQSMMSMVMDDWGYPDDWKFQNMGQDGDFTWFKLPLGDIWIHMRFGDGMGIQIIWRK